MTLRKTMITGYGVLLLTLAMGIPFVPVHAQNNGLTVSPEDATPTSLVDTQSDCTKSGNCTICDGLKVMGRIAQWILASIGGLALFFVIDGGFKLLTSGGKSEKIEAGKKEIGGSIIGLIVTLGIWTLINILFIIFSGPNVQLKDNTAKLFTSPTQWSRIECK